MRYQMRFTEQQIAEMQNDSHSGLTWRKISKKYGISMATLSDYRGKGLFNGRNRSDARKASCVASPQFHSQETKDKISRARKSYLAKHPDQVPYLLNHSSKISYPERYFRIVFKNEGIDLIYHKQVHLYQLDFCREDNKKYVEIDGNSHYSDKKTIEIDARRTKFLSDLGWKGKRVRWSEYQKMDKIQRKNIIEEIRIFTMES